MVALSQWTNMVAAWPWFSVHDIRLEEVDSFAIRGSGGRAENVGRTKDLKHHAAYSPCTRLGD